MVAQKQKTYMVTKYYPTDYLVIQRENVSLKWKYLVVTALAKSSNSVLLKTVRQLNIKCSWKDNIK